MQTYSASKSSNSIVKLVGGSRVCPPGCAHASRPDDVRAGEFFVQFKPVREIGPWSAVASDRPWCVSVKRDGEVRERGAFGSMDEAVKRARRLNDRLAS